VLKSLVPSKVFFHTTHVSMDPIPMSLSVHPRHSRAVAPCSLSLSNFWSPAKLSFHCCCCLYLASYLLIPRMICSFQRLHSTFFSQQSFVLLIQILYPGRRGFGIAAQCLFGSQTPTAGTTSHARSGQARLSLGGTLPFPIQDSLGTRWRSRKGRHARLDG
jgi:hypothetical protein